MTTESDGSPWMSRLRLNKAEKCPTCEGYLFEIKTCVNCGGIFLFGKTNEDDYYSADLIFMAERI